MKRFWEIDATRGLAIVFMVLFNYAFALDYLGIYRIADGPLFWWLFPRIVGGAFIFVAGVSMMVSLSRSGRERQIKRGLKIFVLGMAITAVTLAFTTAPIYFGVLHLIGLSIMLGVFFANLGRLNLLLGAAMIVAGFYLQAFAFSTPWMLWAGFMPHGFTTLDYFPLLPWFGVFLLGVWAGKKFYRKN